MSLKIYIYLFCLIMFISSCITNKKVIYFQDVNNQSSTNCISNNYTPTFHPDDLLSINVSSLDQESTIPFNIQNIQTSSSNAGYATGSPMPNGYLIDQDGMIDFPVIGKIKIGGLNRTDAINNLKLKLSDYLKNPIINIRILNFKITVLGDVARPGTFTIPNERITILEAIGIAGDLSITGKRNNVLVVRDIEGKKNNYRIDLTKSDLFNSPVYYLNQNDVVYIEPNRTKINSSAINPSNAGIIISAASLLMTTIVLLTK